MNTSYTLAKIEEYITYWTAQEDSEQKTSCLKFWLKRAQAYVTYSREVNGNLIPNTGDEVKKAAKLIKLVTGAPIRVAGEYRMMQASRLSSITLG